MMRWFSAEEIGGKIEAIADQDALFRTYALSLFTLHAVYSADFSPSEEWAKAVVPTDSGRRMLRSLSDVGHQFPQHVELFTLFRTFYHRDLLIDHQSTDTEAVLALLRSIHTARSARWPYVFGNCLYHKFNDTYAGNRTDSLEAADVHALLEGTAQGVFQLGHVVSGPLGFLHSEEERVLPPTLRLPLWHCSDPGCRERHFVRLKQYQNDCTRALTAYYRHMADNWGEPSEWKMSLLLIPGRNRRPDGRRYVDLPAVLGDCLIGSELATLCRRALRSTHNSQLIRSLQEANCVIGNPDALAEALEPEEQHQLLLLLPDKDLVHMIDELVWRGAIAIPASEVRKPKTYVRKLSRDSCSQLSSLGIRSTGHPPVVGLSALVWSTYASLDLIDDLVWRVRGHAGTTLRHSVMEFIRAHGPETAITELILSSRDVTTAIAEALMLAVCPEEPREVTYRRFLWKFGFNPPRYEDDIEVLRKRISHFIGQVLAMSPSPSEDERASVRASGVNLFVSVELLLEDIWS